MDGIVAILPKFFQSLPFWVQIGWILSFFLFVAMSCFAVASWSITHHKNSELMQVILPELKSLRKFLSERVESGRGNYFDPAAYSSYFESGNRLLEQAKSQNKNLFENLLPVPVPEASKTTDFDGRGYYTKSQFTPLIENVDRMLALIESTGSVK